MAFSRATAGPALVTAGSGPQFTAWPLPSASRSSTGSDQQWIALWLLPVSSSQSQVAADLGLHLHPSQEARGPAYLEAGFRPQERTTQLAPQGAHPKGTFTFQLSTNSCREGRGHLRRCEQQRSIQGKRKSSDAKMIRNKSETEIY